MNKKIVCKARNNKVTLWRDREYLLQCDIEEGFSVEEVELSDIDGCYYLAGYAPHKTQEQLDKEAADKQISELYDVMVEDVYAKMEEVFGTKNDVSAQAFATTYDAMAKRPENYIGACKRSGEVLNTVEEVAAYANEVIAAIDKYGAWRLARIAQFDADKKKILDGLKKKK